MSDSVALLLKELRLPAFGRHYQSLWETAVEKSWSHTDYLRPCVSRSLLPRNAARNTYVNVDNVIQPASAPCFISTPSSIMHGPRAAGFEADKVACW